MNGYLNIKMIASNTLFSVNSFFDKVVLMNDSLY